MLKRQRNLALLGVIVLLMAAVLVWRFLQPVPLRATSVRLGFNTWVGYGPFYLADRLGFFREEGLDVDLQRIEGTAERRAALIAARLDALGTTIDDVAVGAAQDVPARVVLVVDQSHGADGIVTVTSIARVEDLRGRTVAVQPGFVNHFFLLYVLNQHGIAPDEIRIQAMEPDAAGAAFVAGRIDAAVTWEPWLSKAKTRPDGRVLLTSADVPGIIIDVLAVRNDFARDHPRAVEGLLRAWFRALEYWTSQREEANRIIAESFSLSPREVGEMLSGVKFVDVAENRRFLEVEVGAGDPPAVALLRRAGELYNRAGLVKNMPPAEGLVDSTPLRALGDR